jgi:hypothetical protein
MKRWFALTCPCCGFRFPLKKFDSPMKPIDYPVQIVTGGGRARGFKVEQYLQWATLPSLKQTAAWKSILCLYDRLGAAYDNFYKVLGFLSPEIEALLEGLQKSYASAYLNDRTQGYASTYSSPKSPDAIAETFSEDGYPEAYANLSINPLLGGVCVE